MRDQTGLMDEVAWNPLMQVLQIKSRGRPLGPMEPVPAPGSPLQTTRPASWAPAARGIGPASGSVHRARSGAASVTFSDRADTVNPGPSGCRGP